MTASWTIVLLYFVAGVIGGFARVIKLYGLQGFKTPKVTIDAIMSAAGGVLYPYLVPQVIMNNVPVLAIAFGIAALTYSVNHFFIKLLKRRFGYTEGKPSQGGTP